jgi:hypothetical protein
MAAVKDPGCGLRPNSDEADARAAGKEKGTRERKAEGYRTGLKRPNTPPPGSPKNSDGIGSLYKLQEALILIMR